MAEVYITSQKLIELLKIPPEQLEEIEYFFDADSKDKWDLREGKDYKIICKSTGLREYTPSGAYAIAEYLEATRQASEKGLLGCLKRFFRNLKGNIRKTFVREKILNNCSSLVRRNDIFFISKSDAIAIFSTRRNYFEETAEIAKRSDPLILGEDYITSVEDGDEIYFSPSGLSKLATVFSQRLTRKNRRAWCHDVGDVIADQVERIHKQIKKRYDQIERAKNYVKRTRDKKTCQVTHTRQTKLKDFQLAVHHLYSQSDYPLLADSHDNLITIQARVHQHFHQTMGGFDKSCTIEDFIRYVRDYHPESSDCIMWLEQQRQKLGNPQPLDHKKPAHVLYLPLERIS